MKDGNYARQCVVLANDWSHLAKSKGNTSFECDLGVSVCALEGWEKNVADLLSAKIGQRLAKTVNSGILYLWLTVVEEEIEGLDEIVVSDVFSESISELCEVFGKAESYLPGLVFTSVK